MKALEKDHARRYATANGLANDVQRHLNCEPVTAGPPSKLYRFQKLARRNKLAFATTGAVATALFLGLEVEAETLIGIPEDPFCGGNPRVVSAWPSGQLHARHGRWGQAIADLSKAVDLEPGDHLIHHALAPVLLQSGDVKGYQRHRSAVLARFGSTSDPSVAERMAKDCLIVPASNEELDTISAMADTAIAVGRKHPSWPRFQFAKGLAEYRLGRFASAAEWMQNVLAARSGGSREAHAKLVLAMAQHQLRRADEARATLAGGVQIVDTQLPKLDSPDLGISWSDVLIAHFLKREAQALIEGTPVRAKE